MSDTTHAALFPTTGRPRGGTRTGGPSDDGDRRLEHLAGWALVVVLAMLVTQLGLI